MVNPDDHDRILTDPAYRLEKQAMMQSKVHSYLSTIGEIERNYTKINGGIQKTPLNKVDYITLLEVEKAILSMDRLFNKVDKVRKVILVQC